MSCEVASLPFQAHANYGTWSIDFASNKYLLHSGVKYFYLIQVYFDYNNLSEVKTHAKNQKFGLYSNLRF